MHVRFHAAWARLSSVHDTEPPFQYTVGQGCLVQVVFERNVQTMADEGWTYGVIGNFDSFECAHDWSFCAWPSRPDTD